MDGEPVRPLRIRLMVGAPYKDAYNKFEITPEGIAKRAKTTIDFWKGIYSSDTTNSRCQTHPIAYEEGV